MTSQRHRQLNCDSGPSKVPLSMLNSRLLFSVLRCVHNDWKGFKSRLWNRTKRTDAPSFEVPVGDDGRLDSTVQTPLSNRVRPPEPCVRCAEFAIRGLGYTVENNWSVRHHLFLDLVDRTHKVVLARLLQPHKAMPSPHSQTGVRPATTVALRRKRHPG